MKLHGWKAGWIALAVALAAPLAVVAQAGTGPGLGPGPGAGPGSCAGCGRMGGPGAMRGARAFDPSTVTTIQGQISDVQRVAGPRGRHQGVHLTVATASGDVSVRLGPDFYVDAQPVKLAKGDQVEVKGARLDAGGEPVIVAQEVRRGGDVLSLRDANGAPLWRGQGMRGR